MIQIKEIAGFEPALRILKQIPEFSDGFSTEEFERRLQNDAVILLAWYNGIPAGCKIDYNRFGNKVFYSWLGGVLPEFRRNGLAQQLQEKMELIAKDRGYEFIRFKTRNRFAAMISFGLTNGFRIIDFISEESPMESRIVLQKKLANEVGLNN